MNRRQLLKAGLALAGGLAVLEPRRGLAQPPKDDAQWAFLSDIHIAADPENNHRGFYPYRNLQKVLPQVVSSKPEGLVITGDLARLTGQAGDYENVKKLLAPVAEERPVYLAMGNHDNRANFRRAFEKPAGERHDPGGRHVLAVDAGPVQFLILDSLLLTNETPGLLGKAQRTWLETHLRDSGDRPLILFLHHTVGDEDDALLDAPRLFNLIKPANRVKAIIYGHSHEYAYSEHEGVHLINLPATGYTFDNAQPVGWVEARLTAQSGEFILHATAGNTRLDGQTRDLRWR
jgi:3',5'-cyclic AMP phosphodiesterase CpdA